MIHKRLFTFFAVVVIVVVAIAPVLLAFIFPNVKAQNGSDPWWNTGWKYRRQMTIDNTGGGSLADFQVKIVVPYASSMQSDFRDLRFTDSGSVNLLSYWIEKVEAGPAPSPSYADRIREAAEWIFRGQDVNGPFFRGYGGGVSYWSTASGWSSSDYQEVTGYIIPTILDLYQLNGNVTYRDRALSMADWEVSVQNPDGNFIGYIFDTGMAMQGLLRAYRVSGDSAHLNAANKAADWIISHQLPDGSFGGGVADPGQTYHARVDWILLDLYKTTGNVTHRDAALKNLAWVYGRQQSNGYWDQSNFHFIDYIIQGVLESGVLLQTIDGGAYATLSSTYIDSARKAADALLNQQLSDGSMSGSSYNSNWNPTDATNTLSGDAQISNIWARFYQLTSNATYLGPPRKMNTFLMSTQDVQTTNLAIRGGIDSTWPLSGTKLSWATKFFIDALMNTPEPPPPPPSTPQATVWIKVPSLAAGGSQTVYMYYGNPTASSASDGSAVFDFFDDFSGDLSKWTTVGGTWAIENGELSASTTAFGQRLRAKGITFTNGVVEARIKWISGAYFEQGLCIRGQTDEGANSYVYFLSTWSTEKHRLYKRLSGSSIKIAAGDGPNPSQGVWYDIKVSASGNFLAAVTNPTYGEISGTDSSFSSGTFCLFSWAATPEHVHYGNVRIRKYAFPEPTTTLGPEERVPWTITFQATGVTVSVTVSYTYDSTTGSVTIPVGESVSITVPDGSTLSYVYPSPVTGGDGFQFILKSVSPTSPITVTGDTTVTGTYKTQYLVTFEQTGSGATVHVTYTADTDPIVGVPFSTWVKAGSTLTFSYDAVVNDGQPTRYIFVSVDHTSPLTVNGPITITATYKTQHYLTVRTDPTGIATIPGEGWYDASFGVSLTAPSVSGYVFQYWDVDGVSQGVDVKTIILPMDAPHTATAHYKAIPVGGIWTPTNKLNLLATYILSTSAILTFYIAVVAYVKRWEKSKNSCSKLPS